MRKALLMALAMAFALHAEPKRVLYITHTEGYRHDSIPLSQTVLEALGRDSGAFEVTSSEDLSLISYDGLRNYDALFFFTSGELPLRDDQKGALLDFVRSGKGFGGVHSATDTFYEWPEYGDLIGAYFNGHPWTQEIGVTVEDTEHPTMKPLAPSFRIMDEIYQFREFSRDRVHVLMKLDTTTVDLNAQGVARDDGDFALAWTRPYGEGRVFYTALGHFESTWQDPRFQAMLLSAITWLAGE